MNSANDRNVVRWKTMLQATSRSKKSDLSRRSKQVRDVLLVEIVDSRPYPYGADRRQSPNLYVCTVGNQDRQLLCYSASHALAEHIHHSDIELIEMFRDC
jgi:hypothetical protein